MDLTKEDTKILEGKTTSSLDASQRLEILNALKTSADKMKPPSPLKSKTSVPRKKSNPKKRSLVDANDSDTESDTSCALSVVKTNKTNSTPKRRRPKEKVFLFYVVPRVRSKCTFQPQIILHKDMKEVRLPLDDYQISPLCYSGEALLLDPAFSNVLTKAKQITSKNDYSFYSITAAMTFIF